MRNLRILVVDDEEDIQTILSDRLQMYGYEVLTAADGMEALEKVEEASPDLVLLDIELPKLGGMEVLGRIKSEYPEMVVIMITAHMTVKRAVEAMKQGAYDFIEKPFNLELVRIKVDKALERQALVRENEHLRSELKGEYGEIIAKSKEMMGVLKMIERVAPSDLNVLVTGESGTGKELVARALLLDEIADLPVPLQAKLLRAIQEKEFERVGGTKPIKVDIRFVAATNQDLQKSIQDGKFREDLFYRLHGVEIAIPPLRGHPEDIPVLVGHFLENAARNNRSVQITDEAMELLKSYHWPGNVRELQNCIKSTIVLADSNVIRPEDLPTEVKPSEAPQVGTPANQGATLKDAEKALILKTLEEVNGNRTKAAKLLGISLRKLQYELKKYRDEEGTPC